MAKNFDLNKLLAWARNNGIHFELFYGEASDSLEIRVFSSAPAEEFYMKRVPDIDYFIEAWEENLQKVLNVLNEPYIGPY